MEKEGIVKWDNWFRYGEYRIESIQGRNYIRPAIESGCIFYSFGDLHKKKADNNCFIHCLLNLNILDNEAVLDFIKQYGLLGLLQHKYLEPQKVKFNDTTHYLVPERADWGELREIEAISREFMIDERDFKQAGFFAVRIKMSEPLEDVKIAIKEFQSLGKLLYAIERGKKGVSGPLRSLFISSGHLQNEAEENSLDWLLAQAKTLMRVYILNGNKGLNVHSIYPKKDGWELLLGFESLLSAGYFFLIHRLADDYIFNKCPQCHNLFLSSVKLKQYCSRKCEDLNRKTKKRKEQTKAKLLKQFLNIDQAWLEDQIDSLLKEPGIGTKKAANKIEALIKDERMVK